MANQGFNKLDQLSVDDDHRELPLLNVVALGASAGGLEVIQHWFDNIPPDTGAAYVVLQHLAQGHVSMMDHLLSQHTAMPISVVETTRRMKPNHIYLMSPEKKLDIDGHFLVANDRYTDGEPKFDYPINNFFKRMAANNKINGTAVVLSGTGSDGSLGIKSLYESGGLVLVQDPAEAEFNGMPINAISTGVADMVDGVSVLANALVSYLKSSSKVVEVDDTGRPVRQQLEKSRSSLQQIFDLLQSSSGIDFSLYKLASVNRRMEHRMGLKQFTEISDYLEYLKQPGNDELTQLAQSLLIGVTRFFRDPEEYDVLQKQAIESLILDHAEQTGPIRVWCVACSTGEEAYSLAISFAEMMRQLKIQREVKIFATDLNESNILTAMAGYYPEGLMGDMPKSILSRYFDIEVDGRYRVSKIIRKMLVFAKHNILHDPPFSRIDLLTCRNMLIYFTAEGQRQAFQAINFSLRLGGFLFLGKAETVDMENGQYRYLQQPHKIYKKIVDAKTKYFLGLQSGHAAREVKGSEITTYESSSKFVQDSRLFIDSIQQSIAHNLLSSIVEKLFDDSLFPTLIINKHGEIIKAYGDLTPWMKTFKPGEFYNQLHEIFDDISANYIAKAIDSAITLAKPVRVKNIYHSSKDKYYRISIKSSIKYDSFLFIVTFEWQENDIAHPELNNPTKIESDHYIELMKNELKASQSKLKLAEMELNIATQNLKAVNENLVASNDDLQGGNEELQSVNEELYSLNSEHQEKINQLVQLNYDLDNFIKSTNVAAIFLDVSLRIRRYTPAFSKFTNILPIDINRSFLDLKLFLDVENIEAYLSLTLKTGKVHEGSVTLEGNRIILYKIMPYFQQDQRIDGLIILLNEERLLTDAVNEMGALTHEQSWLYEQNKVAGWNYSFEKSTFTFTKESFLGPPAEIGRIDFYQRIPGRYRSEYIDYQEAAIEHGESFELIHAFYDHNGREKLVHSMIFSKADVNGDLIKLFGIVQDVSEIQSRGQLSNHLEVSYDAAFMQNPIPIAIINNKRLIDFCNPAMCQLFGYNNDDMKGLCLRDFRIEDDHERIDRELKEFLTCERFESISYETFLDINKKRFNVFTKTHKMDVFDGMSKNRLLFCMFFPLEVPAMSDNSTT